MKDDVKRIVVKIGGSVITDKDDPYFPTDIEEIIINSDTYAKKENIKKISNAIANASAANCLELFILNGAGAFGHTLFKKYVDGDKSIRSALVHDSLKYLNSLVVDSLIEAGIPCRSVHPHNNCFYNGNYDVSGLVQKVAKYIDDGITPSSYGDIIPTVDCKGMYADRWQIISADDLAVLTAEKLSADIIMVSATPGVYTKKPEIAPIIEVDHVLSEEEFPKFLESKGITLYQDNSIDLTGKMYKKLFELCNAAARKINSQVCGIDDLEKALSGEHVGTLIRYKNS